MIIEFIQENFLYLHPGYTLLNTVVFGIILGLAILIILRMFKWLKKDPGELFLSLVPFIFFGSSARALVDNGLYPLTLLLVTPGIYVLTGLATIIALFLSIFLEKKKEWDYRYTLFIMGVLICVPNLLMIQHINPVPLLQILGSWALVSAPFILLRNKWWLLKDKFNLSVLTAHLLDASTTFVAVDFYGYGEQHVLPNTLTQLVDTAAVMFPLKITVILTVLYIIDTTVDDKTTRNMLKLAIFILGLAPGLRNLLSLIMGT
ncbi:MAG: DUF63 family protein [Methanobacteriaceae archaeon]